MNFVKGSKSRSIVGERHESGTIMFNKGGEISLKAFNPRKHDSFMSDYLYNL